MIKSVIVPIDKDLASKLGITDINTYMRNYASTMNSVATSFGKISKHSNEMNVEAINASTEMFNALAYLASAGKDNALKELGESLIEAVKELASMIADFEGTVKDVGTQNNETGLQIGGVIDGLKSIVTQAFGGNQTRGGQSSFSPNIDTEGIIDAIENLQNKLVFMGIKINNN
jgi:hypothetical protein